MKKILLFLGLVMAVVTIWYLSIEVIVNKYGAPTDAAAAGDMFGGINALFSGLALAGIVFAVWLQTLDVQTNRENLRKTMETNKQSLEIMALSSLIQEADSALQRYERWEKSGNSTDYSEVKKTVRDKLKILRERLEDKLFEVENL